MFRGKGFGLLQCFAGNNGDPQPVFLGVPIIDKLCHGIGRRALQSGFYARFVRHLIEAAGGGGGIQDLAVGQDEQGLEGVSDHLHSCAAQAREVCRKIGAVKVGCANLYPACSGIVEQTHRILTEIEGEIGRHIRTRMPISLHRRKPGWAGACPSASGALPAFPNARHPANQPTIAVGGS